MQLLIRNARQILGVAAAAFGEELFDLNSSVDPCSGAMSDADELACDWRLINKQLSSFPSYEDVSPEWVHKVTKVRATSQPILTIHPPLLTPESGFARPRTS